MGGCRVSQGCLSDVCEGSGLRSTSGCKGGTSAEFHPLVLCPHLHNQICYLVHSKNSNIAYIRRETVYILLAHWQKQAKVELIEVHVPDSLSHKELDGKAKFNSSSCSRHLVSTIFE